MNRNFILTISFVVIQGVINSLGYYGFNYSLILIAISLGISVAYFSVREETNAIEILLKTFAVIFLIFQSLSFTYTSDIHLWTALAAWTWYASYYEEIFIWFWKMLEDWKGQIFSNHGLYGVALAVYPALIIQKGLINLGAGEDWFFVGTDDPTGATFCIPTIDYCISRSSQVIRYTLAFLSFGFLFLLNAKNA